MGTRLYPNTNDPRVLERLAGVPEGTHEKLATLREKYAELAREAQANCTTAEELARVEYDLDSQEFEAISADRNTFAYDSFIIFGWGRIKNLRLIDRDYDLVVGNESQPDKVEAILKMQRVDLKGVTLAEIGGVHWS
ncbi:MAG: hypothetical protein HY741_15865 [Chloroflexi bacterium]|nr:hypothetical protein [Chloroflexota bacterium]